MLHYATKTREARGLPWLWNPDQLLPHTALLLEAPHFIRQSSMQQVYATIKEKTKHRDVTVCGGSRRMKPVLVTDSHEAVVTIVSHGGQQDKPYFLLKYTGQTR